MHPDPSSMEHIFTKNGKHLDLRWRCTWIYINRKCRMSSYYVVRCACLGTFWTEPATKKIDIEANPTVPSDWLPWYVSGKIHIESIQWKLRKGHGMKSNQVSNYTKRRKTQSGLAWSLSGYHDVECSWLRLPARYLGHYWPSQPCYRCKSRRGFHISRCIKKYQGTVSYIKFWDCHLPTHHTNFPDVSGSKIGEKLFRHGGFLIGFNEI